MSTENKVPLVAIYARQSVKVDEGIEQQIKACREFAKDRNWIVVDTFEDNQTSGSQERDERTNWSRLLKAVDAGKVDTVLAVAVDRITRRSRDAIELSDRHARVVTVRDGMDSATASGRQMMMILVAIAEGEVARKSERAVPYRDERLARGIPTAGRVPYGYIWVAKSTRDARRATGDEKWERRYDVHPEESKVIELLFALAMNQAQAGRGVVLRELAATLNRGPAMRPVGDSQKGGIWRSTTIRRILLSPFYAALLPRLTEKGTPYRAEDVDLDDCIKGMWDRLVDPNILRVVRHSLLNSARRTNGGETARKWLLGGLARCGAEIVEPSSDGLVRSVCGEPLRTGASNEGHRTLRCPAGHLARRAEVIDHYVERVILERLSAPDAASMIQPSPEVNVDGLRARQAVLETTKAEAVRGVTKGLYTLDSIEADLRLLNVDLGMVADQLSSAMSADPIADIAASDDVAAYWADLSLSRRRAILDSLLRVVVLPVGKGSKITSHNVAQRVHLAWWRNVDQGCDWAHPITLETVVALA
jgi:site-specific DNA recombinase